MMPAAQPQVAVISQQQQHEAPHTYQRTCCFFVLFTQLPEFCKLCFKYNI